MRKLGKRITQKGSGRRSKKNLVELVTELTHQHRSDYVAKKNIVQVEKKTTKKQIAKSLRIKPAKLRAYEKYFEEKPGGIKPPEKVLKKLRSIAKKYKVTVTRPKGEFFPRMKTESLKELVNDSSYSSINKQKNLQGFFGFLIRVQILFETSSGFFKNWLTFVVDGDEIRTKNALNSFLVGEIKKNIRAKNSIKSFTILQTVIDTTLNTYEEPSPRNEDIKPSGKGKKRKQAKK